MNKKIIALIIGILVVAAAATAFVLMNSNNQNQTNQNSTQNTNTNEKTATEGDENVNTEGKALVLYFTQSGNTETVAKFIQEKVQGDLVKLETTKTYASDYNELIDEAQEEQRNNERPELKTNVNIDDYDIIFLGYPNWWGDMPMPIYSFLDKYDLSGKTIAPFITHGGSGLSGTPGKIQNAEPNATVTEGLAVSGSSASGSQSTVNSWLEGLGF